MTPTIRALVIQLGNWQYLCGEGTGLIGDMQDVPCQLQMEDAEYWAVPQKDEGIFTQLQFVSINDYPEAPTYDSFQVFRIYDKLTGYVMWIRGTFAEYAAACAVCCGNPAIPMPTDTPLIAPCQTLCQVQTSNGVVQANFGIPTNSGGPLYVYGSHNNTPYPQGGPFASNAALLTFLNASYSPFTWTIVGSNLPTLVATGGYEGDSLCVVVTTTLPTSPASM